MTQELPAHLGGQKAGNIDLGVVRTLRRELAINSMVDIGCGDGVATKAYARLGIDVVGVDGDWTRLPANDERFVRHDFTTGPIDLGRFDLAYSVEFLEHLEERHLPNVMPLFAACRFAVVTAAPPGQVGHHHVNCRTPEYWQDVFADYGMTYDPDYTERLRAASTFCKARGQAKNKPLEFFQRCGMFFRCSRSSS